jgi:hypothetical protein
MLRRLAVLVVLGALGSAGAQPTPSAGRNDTGLLGVRLAPIDDAAGAVVDLIFSTRKGTIGSATVVDDTDRAIVVEAEFSGAPTGRRRLRAAVQDASGKDLPELEAAPVDVTAASGKARIAIALRAGLVEGFAVESSRLRLEIRKDNAVQYDTDRVFALPRRWTTAVRPENVVVNATPTPSPPRRSGRPGRPRCSSGRSSSTSSRRRRSPSRPPPSRRPAPRPRARSRSP